MTALNSKACPMRDDAELVAQSLSGDRDAFGYVVARYQSLICSMAYSATGSLSQSEDLAQDTFLAAWKQLADLREPAKLRSWLCGIARNLIHNSLRRQERQPIDFAQSLEEVSEAPAREPLPVEEAISREEETILWRALEQIPEIYREPLVLFYREHKSAMRVAEILDLSEEAVHQRLSRGRKLLQEHVLAFVESALERTQPGRAFTENVVAALPLLSRAYPSGAAAPKALQLIKGALKAMAWTKTKTAITVSAVVLLGTTTTLVGLKLALGYWAERFAQSGLSPTQMTELYSVAADGSVQVRATVEEANLTSRVVRTDRINDLDSDYEITDESGHPMKFSKQRPRGYVITFNPPVRPGQKVSFTINGGMGRLFKLNQSGEYEFETTQQQGNEHDMRLVEVWRFPSGASLLESSPAELEQTTNRDGQVELRLDKTVPPWGTTPLAFRYRLAEGTN
jgi:RNA polymerase sigma factor (sigma-70 family)